MPRRPEQSLLDACHSHAPAIRVLRQPHVLTQLLAAQQVRGGGRQIVLLTEKLAHTHIQVCGSPQDRVTLCCRKLQSPLIGAHGFAQTTLRDPDICQGDHATDRLRDNPGPLHPRHALGIRPVGRLEIPARPCQSQERHCRSALEMVVLRNEVERSPRVCHRVGYIAQCQGLSGTVHGDGTREMAKLHFVHDDHFRRWARHKLTPVCGRIQPALGGTQTFLNAVELALGQ
jgi:hypothetical protein